MNTNSLIPIAYSLVGALLGFAMSWARQSEVIKTLLATVEELKKEAASFRSLVTMGALQAQEIAHLKTQFEAQKREVRALTTKVQGLDVRCQLRTGACPPEPAEEKEKETE